jgi:hypothetical protein
MGAGSAFIRRNDATPIGRPLTRLAPSTNIANGPSPSNGKMGNRNADGTPYVPPSNTAVDQARRAAALKAAQARKPGVWEDFRNKYETGLDQATASADLWSDATGTRTFADGRSIPYNEGVPQLDFPGLPTPPSPGGSGSGSGYGVNQKKQWDDYRAAQMAILAGMTPYDVGPAPVDTMTGRINTAVDADVKAVRGAWSGVDDLNTNAYRDMPAVRAQISDPNIGALLRAQGMDGDFAAATQAQQQQDMDGLAALWSHFGSAETARTDQANAGRNALVDEMTALDIADSEQQRASMLASAGMNQERLMREYDDKVRGSAAQNTDAKRALIQELLRAGLAGGMDISGIDIDSLLGGL